MRRKCVLLPLFWSALHLLVNYRMTCTDPRLPLFAFGLLADVMLVLAFYQIARLLYGRPQPMLLALFGALAAVMSFSDLGGYGLARLMGVTSVAWPGKMLLLRSGLSAAACIYVLAQLFVLTARETQITRNEGGDHMLFVCYPKCSTCAKARKWLEEQGISFEERDIKTDNPTERRSCATGTAAAVCRSSGFSIRAAFSTRRWSQDRLPEMSERTSSTRCSRPTACSSSVRCSSGRTSRFPASGKRNGGKKLNG